MILFRRVGNRLQARGCPRGSGDEGDNEVRYMTVFSSKKPPEKTALTLK